MVAQQILRVAVAGVVVAAGAGAVRAQSPEAIAVIELRAGDDAALSAARAPVDSALAASPQVASVAGDTLRAALLGARASEGGATADDAASEALATAGEAYGELDCEGATGAADVAIDWLARAQATGADVAAKLAQAYSYQLLCAHAAGDTATALDAAQRLRAIHEGRPQSIPAAVWDAYPAYDATANVYLVEVAIASAPAGATIYVDHRPAGDAPLSLHLPEGRHIIAAGAGDASAVRRLAIQGRDAQRIELELERPAGDTAADARTEAVRDWVSSWRSRGYAPTDYEMTQLLAIANVRFALVLAAGDGGPQLQLWGRAPYAKVASQLGAGRPEQAAELVELAMESASQWAGGAPAGPLGGDSAEPDDNRKPWWVYASVIGAVGVGALVILATDLAEDRQVIELRYP